MMTAVVLIGEVGWGPGPVAAVVIGAVILLVAWRAWRSRDGR
jgi:hypothetical protein